MKKSPEISQEVMRQVRRGVLAGSIALAAVAQPSGIFFSEVSIHNFPLSSNPISPREGAFRRREGLSQKDTTGQQRSKSKDKTSPHLKNTFTGRVTQ